MEGHIYRVRFQIGGDFRTDIDEGIAAHAGDIGERIDGILNRIAPEQITRLGGHRRFERGRVELLQLGYDIDLAEAVNLALVNRVGDVEILLVGRKLCHGGFHTEIIIPLVLVELAEQFAVIFQTARIIIVIRRKELPPARLPRDNFGAEPVVRIRLIAEKVDGTDAGNRAFGNRENHVHTVLAERHIFRDDLGRKPAGLAVELHHALDIGLHTGSGEHAARGYLYLFANFVFLQRLAAFDHDAVDDGVFHKGDDELVPDAIKTGIGEQACGEQGFQRQVDPVGIKGRARLDEEVGQDRPVFDPLVSIDDDGLDVPRRVRHACLCDCRGLEGTGHGGEQQGERESSVFMAHEMGVLKQ